MCSPAHERHGVTMTSQFDSMFEESAAPMLDEVFGVSVVLQQGPLKSAAFTATFEDVDVNTLDEGFPIEFELRVFVFAVADVVLGGEVEDPGEGDRLTFTENGVEKAFDILPDGNQPAVRKLAGGFRWRVLTKKVK